MGFDKYQWLSVAVIDIAKEKNIQAQNERIQ